MTQQTIREVKLEKSLGSPEQLPEDEKKLSNNNNMLTCKCPFPFIETSLHVTICSYLRFQNLTLALETHLKVIE